MKTMDSPNEITRQIEVWLAAVRAEDVDKLLSFYAPDAILLPTFSSALRHTPEERREYFERFLGSRPRGRVVEQNPRRYGSVAINSGLYTFTVTDPQGDREIAPVHLCLSPRRRPLADRGTPLLGPARPALSLPFPF